MSGATMASDDWHDARRVTPYPEDVVWIQYGDGYEAKATYAADGNYYIRCWETWSSKVIHNVHKWRRISG